MATTQPATGPASFEIVVPARNEADRLPEGLAALASIWLRSRIPGGPLPAGQYPPLTRQERPSADLGRLAAGAAAP